jgi:hypothetical protein
MKVVAGPLTVMLSVRVVVASLPVMLGSVVVKSAVNVLGKKGKLQVIPPSEAVAGIDLGEFLGASA